LRKTNIMSKTISFRVNDDEYSQILLKCRNSDFGLNITPGQLAKKSIFYTTIKSKNQDLEKYRIITAARISIELNKIAEFIDSEHEKKQSNIKHFDYAHLLIKLEQLETKLDSLLKPFSDH